jgi:sterol desaturase/sphingolipid hydroxylase (fatty acid hydroxylase superfamily)
MNFANQQITYVFVLYGIVVLIPFFIFCKMKPEILSPWKVDLKNKKDTKTHEVKTTVSSFFVLYGVLLLAGLLRDNGILTFKENLSGWYYVLSFPLVVILHDTYFYWTHFLMHKSKFLFQFHKDHHIGHDATPLDVYAFHPIEAFVHFIFFLIYPLIIPSSLATMQFMFIWMLVCNSAGHLSYEFYPKYLYDFPIIKQFNTATHHLMHHKFYNSNFSLYYNWWDRWMGTNHKDYFETYQNIKKETEIKARIKDTIDRDLSAIN